MGICSQGETNPFLLEYMYMCVDSFSLEQVFPVRDDVFSKKEAK